MEPACLPRDEMTTLDLGFQCSDLWVCINLKKLGESKYIYLTFKNRASYIQDGRTATLQMLHFIYFFQQI